MCGFFLSVAVTALSAAADVQLSTALNNKSSGESPRIFLFQIFQCSSIAAEATEDLHDDCKDQRMFFIVHIATLLLHLHIR